MTGTSVLCLRSASLGGYDGSLVMALDQLDYRTPIRFRSPLQALRFGETPIGRPCADIESGILDCAWGQAKPCASRYE
jgi:hypothetical protein